MVDWLLILDWSLLIRAWLRQQSRLPLSIDNRKPSINNESQIKDLLFNN